MKVADSAHRRGTPLLFLHGSTVAGWMWEPQIAEFDDYHVLVPDLPGFGASAGETWRSIADTADSLAALLPAPAHVVGLSLGSSVAIELAARHPESVSSLFLASTQATSPSAPAKIMSRLMLTFWERHWFWHGLARSYGLHGDDAAQLVSTGLGIRRETVEAIHSEVVHGISAATLAGLACPTLAVAGARDRGAVASLRLLPTARAIAPGVGHQWNVEAPDLFNASLRTWIEHGAVGAGLRVVR